MRLIAVLLVVPWAPASLAGDAGLQVGLGMTVARGPAPAFDVALVTERAAPGGTHWQVGLTLIGASIQAGDAEPRQAAISALLVNDFGPLELGAGVVLLQDTDGYNGSRANFALQVSYRFRRWPVTASFRHWSNAGLEEPNLGRDFALLNWRF